MIVSVASAMVQEKRTRSVRRAGPFLTDKN